MDTSALLPSERDFFNDQVALLTKYKDCVLDRIIHLKEFEAPAKEEEKKPDVMADVKQEIDPESTPVSKDDNETSPAMAGIPDKKRILIVDSMPTFMGLKGEVLGPYNEGEEVELDTQIAELLVKRGKAEAVQ